MNGGPLDISVVGLLATAVLLVIPVAVSLWLRLGLVRSMLFSALRMAVQLALMAFYLGYLFRWDNAGINLAWMGVMLAVAAGTVVKRSGLKARPFILPVFASQVAGVLTILLYFNRLVLNLDAVLSARYFLVVGGMLVGNSLRGNVIGLSNFYQAIRRNEARYLAHLSLGASVAEATAPYLRQALLAALNPTIASMATMGIVWLPGMMTGQMLGGASPLTAIQYQVAIMVSIFVLGCGTVLLSILMTRRRSFDDFGRLRAEWLKPSKD